MKTIDRYIIKQFLLNFVILLVVLMGLIIMIDLVLQMDEFMKEARRLTQEGQTRNVVFAIVWTAWNFYLPFVPLLFVFLSGLVTVAAMGFTFIAMSRAGELVALASSGVSMYRVAAPILVVGALLNSVSLVNQEWVIPPLAPKLMRKHSHLEGESIRRFSLWLTPDDQGRLISGLFVPDGKDTRLEKLTILVRNDKGQTTRRLTAEQAFWNGNRDGWELSGVNEMRWSDQGQVGSSGATNLQMNTGTPEGLQFFKTSLSPKVILAKRQSFYARLLSMKDLRSLLDNPNVNRANILKIMNGRLSLLVMNVLILVMGLPFFLSTEPGNPLKQVVTAAAVCMGAWFGGLVILQIPVTDMNPVATAWLPVAMCVILSAWLMTRVRT